MKGEKVMEKTEFGMEQGERKTTPKLEICFMTVKKDGSFGDHININSDIEDCWFVNYDEFTCIVDSAARIIELGSIDIDPDELMGDWFKLENPFFPVELQHNKHFLDKLEMFIEKIDANRWAEDYQPQDPTIKTFDLLWSHGYISKDPIAVGKTMQVDPAYLDSFIEWYVKLNDLEYTPWISEYQDKVEGM